MTDSTMSEGPERYVLIDPANGSSDTYATWDDAAKAYDLALGEYRSYAGSDGWPEEIDGLCIAQIMATTEQCDVRRKADSDPDEWTYEWDEVCDYRMADRRADLAQSVPEEVVERARFALADWETNSGNIDGVSAAWSMQKSLRELLGRQA